MLHRHVLQTERLCFSITHTLKPNHQCDGIWREIFERGLGHESGGLMNGVSALNKEAPDCSLTSSTK